MDVLFNVFWFLVVITIVVFIHEYGHYIIARLNNVKIDVFSIGFGKEIWGYTDRNGTRWKICPFPFGGYVKMHGDADASSKPDFKKLKKLTKAEKAQSFYFKKLPQKAAIVFAGPLFNYLSAIIILAGLFWMTGKVFGPAEISKIMEDTPAQTSGLMVGDLILEVDNEKVDSFEDVRNKVILNTGKEIMLTISRNGAVKEISLTPKMRKTKDAFGNEIELPVIGIVADKVELRKLNLLQASSEAVKETYNISANMLKALGQIITGMRSSDQLGGPIKIAQYSGQSASSGFYGFMFFIALISINLGLINLFPIPMLDGGHLMYYLIEQVQGKAVSEKIQMIGFRIGFALLIALMLYVTFNDINSLLKVGD